MNEHVDEVAILLCTFNGGKYLKELIESILTQSYEGWHLYIHDDGSEDDTLHVLAEFNEKIDKISIIYSDNHVGARDGFINLLNSVNADYYMFCDQDDVWFPNKIKDSIDFIKNIELNRAIPVAIGTDLTVTDSQLNIISKSLFSYANVDIEWFKRDNKYIYIANPFVGCTVTINNALKNVCSKIPSEAIMHDWWLAQIAFENGLIDLLQKPTIYYRQHQNNVVGTKGINSHSINYWLFKIRNIGSFFKSQKRIFRMSKLNGCTLQVFIKLKLIQLYRKII